MSERPQPRDLLDCGCCYVGWPTRAPGGPLGTGYAMTIDDRIVCYGHGDESEREALAALLPGEAFIAYVSSDGEWLTTWPGGKLARTVQHGVGRHNFAGTMHSYRFRSPDGAEFYGRNSEGPGMVIAVKRAKVAQ